MRVRLAAMAAVLTLLSVPAGAQGFIERNAMGRQEVIAAFVDQQLSGVYPSGIPWSELIRSDGTSDYREGGSRREGLWWMRGDDFCFRYSIPLSGGCFRVMRLGTNCYELYAVNPGELPAPGPRAGASWNGRMWRDDTAPTCDERATS